MLISCPNCATNFSVPDHALGPTGRKLKCAKCGHKWHQAPVQPQAPAHEFGLDENSFPPTPPAAPPRMEDDFRPVHSPSDLDDEPIAAPAPPSAADRVTANLDLDLDNPPIPDLGPRMSAEGRPSDLDLDAPGPEPIPSVFAAPEAKKGGTGALWLVVLLLVLAGLGGGAYYFQDRVVELWPPAHDLLTDVGLRREKAGAGLELRPAGTPERFVHNDNEVLIVRGVIANVSDRQRPVPTMKLVLLDANKAVVQEKTAPPPVTVLDPSGTAGFRIILERPDPNAVEVNVLFVDPAEDK
ncbi:MAG: DUF3426 domain-containing protein [Solirubrobacterales bacterium]